MINCTDIVMALASCVSAIAAIAMIFVARAQLIKMNKSLNDSNLMSNFNVEFELNRRKERVADLRKDCEDYLQGKNTERLTDEEKSQFKRLDGRYSEALEDYFNVFDRLCYFILKNKLNEEDFRTEYRDMLSGTIKAYESRFGPGTIYRNMVKLNEKWAEK